MATTPFSDIKRPICGESVEIGQATFTELISVRQKTTKPAIGNATPSVSVALKEVAFGRSCRGETQDPSTPGSFVSVAPTPATPSSSVAASKYSINGGGQAYKQTVAELEMAKSTAEFNTLVVNAESLPSDCESITGNPGVPDLDLKDCSSSVCGIDAVFSVGQNGTLISFSKGTIVRDSFRSIIELIVEVTGGTIENGSAIEPHGNYRFGYNNFGQTKTTNGGNLVARSTGGDRTLRLTPQYCGNTNPSRQYDNMASIINQNLGTGESTGVDQHQPWHQALEAVAFNIHDADRLGTGAISFENTQNWTFREDAENISRVLFIYTNKSREIGSLGPDEEKALAAASEMGRCGIKLVIIWLGSPALGSDAAFFNELVDRADGGIWLNSPPTADAVVSQLTSFINSLCDGPPPPPPECAGGEDLLLNGTFDLNLSGWDIIGNIVWDNTFETSAPNDPIGKGSAKLDTSGTLTQRIIGTPGDFLDINFNWCFDGDPEIGIVLLATPVDSSTVKIPIVSGISVIEDDPPCSTNRNTRAPIRVVIPEDGIVDVRFDYDGIPSEEKFLYIDNIVACTLSNNECGPGRTNTATNPNFEDGVEGWTDAAGVALPPTSSTVWDNSIFAIIINVAEENEVRQQITGLDPGTNVSLNFELSSWEPASTGSLEFIFGIVETGNSTTLTRSTATVPERYQIEFIVPNDGIATIFFRGGNPSGIAKVRNVLVCTASTGECETGQTKISFDGFDNNRGAWSGGIYDSDNELMLLDAETPIDSPDRTINQSFPGLPVGSIFHITFSNLMPPPADGSVAAALELHLISGVVDDPFTIPAVAGTYTFQSTVQSTGLMTVALKATVTNGYIDDILCCTSDATGGGDCDGSITDVQALIEWQGIPRQPVNFFNAIIRYTIRNPLDPLDITEFTFVADNEGRLGIDTCELWKSEVGPDTTILGRGLNPALIGTIIADDIDSIATKNNWLWSIPQNTPSTQDNLIINFPDPTGLVENVKFLFLINNTTPEVGTDTVPVFPPPLACTPDPATEFDIIIRFTNSEGLQREFRVPVAENTIWEEEEDFGQNALPWDTDSSTGNGIKGSTARWEETDFLLDTVDGRGLDQCTIPMFFAADGEGDLVFQKFGLSGNGVFVNSCNAEIIIEDVTAGGSANEIQSIVLPTPSGGTWTLAFTYGGSTQTATLPWNTTAEQLRVRLSALSNITNIQNVNVTGSGTLADPFLVEFTNDLGAIDHEMMVADGDGLTGASSAFISTENDGTTNERQRIVNPTDGRQDLVITFAGSNSVAMPYGSSLNVVQSALEGIIGIGAGNIIVTGDITDRDAFYIGPYIVDFIEALANTNVATMIAAPDHYVVSTDWHGGPSGGQNEKQLINVQATGGTFALRLYNLGSSAAPSVVITTSQDGGVFGKDCYDIEFGGTLTGDNIGTNSFFGPSASFVHTQQNIQQGESGTITSPINEIQRHCFEWLSKLSGFTDDDSQFGLTDPSDTIFSDIIDTVAGDLLTRGIDSRTAIKTYLESATGVTTDDLTLTVESLSLSENEAQVITIKNNPTGGTFTLTVEGETTTPIPFDATALIMRDTLRALPNLSGTTVGKGGSFPDDVVYAITFASADGGRDWQQMTVNYDNLESGADFADTAPIAYNATPSVVKNALVTAASFLTSADVDITEVVADEVGGLFVWRAEFTGAFAKQDVRQMEANGANISGAPIIVEEFQKGGGTNDRQRLTIVNATDGSFRLTVTIDEIGYKTTPIPWNTTVAGLQSQLLALAPFVAEDLTVTEIPKTESDQQLRSIITFKKKFGDVPLIVADFQSTLLCNPIMLPYVDPGPYNYPLQDCDDIDDDLSCQPGPLLCRPGEGDEPIVLEPCCDADTIPLAVNCSTRLDFQRHLFDPNTVSTPGCAGVGGVALTIRDLAVLKGLNPANYVPYFRNFSTQVFTSASYSTKIDTKMSVILIENELDTRRGHKRVTDHLKNHREILPARFVWPDCDVTIPAASEACWPGIGSN